MARCGVCSWCCGGGRGRKPLEEGIYRFPFDSLTVFMESRCGKAGLMGAQERDLVVSLGVCLALEAESDRDEQLCQKSDCSERVGGCQEG